MQHFGRSRIGFNAVYAVGGTLIKIRKIIIKKGVVNHGYRLYCKGHAFMSDRTAI